MNINLDTILRDIVQDAPSAGLNERIMARVAVERRRLFVFWSAFFGGAILVSLAALVTTSLRLFSDFRQSGFADYLSLVFTDGEIVLAFWTEYALSLAESLPVVGIVSCLASLFVLLVSIKHAARFFTRSLPRLSHV